MTLAVYECVNGKTLIGLCHDYTEATNMINNYYRQQDRHCEFVVEKLED